MAVPKRLHDSKGLWRGTSQLHLSYLPPEQRVSESPSELRIDTDAHDAYATVATTWEHEGEPQSGTMLIGMDGESKAVQIGWADSFHSNAGVMHLIGAEAETGAVEARATFPVGEDSWAWTIVLDSKGDELTLSMDVVPSGEEPEWAVRAVYRRA